MLDRTMRLLSIASSAAMLLVASSPGPGGQVVAAEDNWHIGLCHVGLDHDPPSLASLQEELASRGYVEGENLRFDYRNQESEETANEQMKSWIAEGVDLIVTFEDQCVRAARAATSTTPIVFVHALDPVASGFIESLRRPGGNLTGPVSYQPLISKRMELFKEIHPNLGRLLVLTDPSDPMTGLHLKEARQAGPALGIELMIEQAEIASDLERIFSDLQSGAVDGAILASKDLGTNQMRLFIDLANKARIPVAAHREGWVEAGALFSYAPNFAAAGPVAADYVDRILKGADPGDLPVDVISQIDLVINLKKGKELGIVIPSSVLARADEVIE